MHRVARLLMPWTLLLVLGACSEAGSGLLPSPPPVIPLPPPAPGPAVTGPGPFLVSNAGPRMGAALLDPAGGGDPGQAWISLRPGTLPGATAAALLVRRTGATRALELLDGGLDPVAIEAVAGDTVVLTVTGGVAPAPFALVFTVPERTPPVIVRTVPPRGTRDVALNTRVQVIFSEPIASSVLNGGAIELRTGGGAVPGQLRFLNQSRTMLEFAPDAELAAGTSYELVVTQAVRDLDGTAFEQVERLVFATLEGDGSSVPPAEPPPSPPAPIEPGVVLQPIPGMSADYLFERDRQMYLVTGSLVRQLTPGPAQTHGLSPAWSPDGNRIAFLSDREGGPSIYVMDADGGNLTRLTADRSVGRPTWTPDGQGIVFAGDGGLVKVPAEGGPVTPVLNWDFFAHQVTDFAFSPDGRTAVFQSPWPEHQGLGEQGNLYSMTIGDPASVRPILLGISERHYGPVAWSPDGRQLAILDCAWNSEGALADCHISTAHPDGTGLERRTDPFEFGGGFSWSPTGSHIAFTVRNCATMAPCIRVVSLGGGATTDVLDFASGLVWRP